MGEIRGSVMQTVLEERLNSAFSLHLPREFRHTINIYIRNLVQTGKNILCNLALFFLLFSLDFAILF